MTAQAAAMGWGVATHRGTPGAVRSRKDPVLEPPEGMGPHDTRAWDFQAPERDRGQALSSEAPGWREPSCSGPPARRHTGHEGQSLDSQDPRPHWVRRLPSASPPCHPPRPAPSSEGAQTG